jgi:hypothetical protein
MRDQKPVHFYEPLPVEGFAMTPELQNRDEKKSAWMVQVKTPVRCADGEDFEDWTQQLDRTFCCPVYISRVLAHLLSERESDFITPGSPSPRFIRRVSRKRGLPRTAQIGTE